MSESRENRSVERSCRLFQRLLVIYPRMHREEYGAAILQLFRDQCRDAWERARMRGLIGFWIHAFADLLKTSVLEHLSNLNRNKSMLKYFRPQFTPFPVFLRIFGGVFLFALLASVIITFMSPEMFRSSTRVLVKYVLSEDTAAAMRLPDHSIIQVQVAAIQSHATLNKVSQALNLPTVWGKKYNGGQPMTESAVESMLRSRLEIVPIRGSDIIEISAYSESPEEAAQLANKVAEAYRQTRAGTERQNNTAPHASIASSVVIIGQAVPDSTPVRPNKPLNMVLGVMFGIVMGLLGGVIGAGLIAAAKKHRNISAALNS
jgi:capsular polysaccharide biosynthesis protein